MILATGFGLLALVHHDVQAIAADIVRHLHTNLASHYPRIDAYRNLTDDRLRMLAVLAFCDAVLRGIPGKTQSHGSQAAWFA